MPLPAHIPASKAANLLSVTYGAISHDIERGRFQDVRRVGGHTFIALTEVLERLGRPLTEEERHALEQPAKRGRRATLTDGEWAVVLDAGVQRLFAEMRDTDWLHHLRAIGVGPVRMPKMPEQANIELDFQKFFTRAQVEALLNNALTQRDIAWRNWIASDLVTQAQNRNGPAPLCLRNITSTEE